MNILTARTRYTEGDRIKEFEREIRTGLHLKKSMESQREAVAAAQAHGLKNHRTIPGLGKCVAVIPEWEFFRLNQKMHRNEINSKDFIRYFQRKFPHLSPNKV